MSLHSTFSMLPINGEINKISSEEGHFPLSNDDNRIHQRNDSHASPTPDLNDDMLSPRTTLPTSTNNRRASGSTPAWKTLTNTSKFVVHLMNAQSISRDSKRLELQEHVNRHAPDVVLITETWLRDNFTLRIKGYNVTRNDRADTTGGGTAVLTKKHFTIINCSPNTKVQSFEFSAVVVRLQNGAKLALLSVYRSRRKQFNPAELTALIQELKQFSTKLIVGGDFNAQILSHGNANTTAPRTMDSKTSQPGRISSFMHRNFHHVKRKRRHRF